MSEVHDKLVGLAQRLEFCNALLRQAQRELAEERIEHGKTKSLVMELEERLSRRPSVKLTKAEKMEWRKTEDARRNKALVAENKRLVIERDRLIAKVNQPKMA